MKVIDILNKIEPYLWMLHKCKGIGKDECFWYRTYMQIEKAKEWSYPTSYLEASLQKRYNVSYRNLLRKRHIYNMNIHMKYKDFFGTNGLFARLKAYSEADYNELLPNMDAGSLDVMNLFRYGNLFLVDTFNEDVLRAIFYEKLPIWKRLNKLLPSDWQSIVTGNKDIVEVLNLTSNTDNSTDISKEVAINEIQPQTQNEAQRISTSANKIERAQTSYKQRDAFKFLEYIKNNKTTFWEIRIESIIAIDVKEEITLKTI